MILSGVLPNPKEILTLLDELGVRIAHDNLLNCSRRLLVPPGKADDPFEINKLTKNFFSLCCTIIEDFKKMNFGNQNIIGIIRTTGIITISLLSLLLIRGLKPPGLIMT